MKGPVSTILEPIFSNDSDVLKKIARIKKFFLT